MDFFDEREHRVRRNKFYATVAKGLERDTMVRGGQLQWRTKEPHVLAHLIYQHRHQRTRWLCPRFTRIAWNFSNPWIQARRFWGEYEVLDVYGGNYGTEITVTQAEEDALAIWLPSWIRFRDEGEEKPEPFPGLEKLTDWNEAHRVYLWSDDAAKSYDEWHNREQDRVCHSR